MSIARIKSYYGRRQKENKNERINKCVESEIY